MFAGLALAASVHLKGFELTLPSGHVQEVALPFSEQSPRAAGEYELSGMLKLGFLSPKRLHVTPDDTVVEVIVNDKTVDLQAHTEGALSDFVRGFELDLTGYLVRGENQITIRFWDRGGIGLYGMDIVSAGFTFQLFALLALLLFVLPIAIKVGKTLSITPLQWVCYSLVVIGAVIQVVVIFVYNPVDHIWSDPARHWIHGIEALRIDLMSMTDPILYQLYVGILAKLTLNMPHLVAFYTSLLAVVTPWVWYKFFRELQASKSLALLGWAFLSLLPSWMAVYSYFMQETLLLPLLGAALWATWRCRRKSTVASFSLMILLWVAAGLTRGITIPMAAVCCTWLWLAQDQKWHKAVYSSLLLVLIMGPLTYRSYQTVGHFAPHGMGHLAAIYGMSGKKEIVLHTSRAGSHWTHSFGSPSTGAKPFAPLSDWRTQREGKVIVNVDLSKGSEDWSKAYEQVEMDWHDLWWITKENLIFLFFAPSWPDNNAERLVDNLNIHMRWLWAPSFLLALIGTVVLRRRLRGNWMLPAVLLSWFMVQGLLPISVNEGRYRKPFEGLIVAQIILLAAAARGRTTIPQTHYPPLGSWLAHGRDAFRRRREGRESA